MPNKRIHEEFLAELAAINQNIEIKSQYQSNNTPIECKCVVCGFEWKTAPSHLLNGSGCRKCSASKRGRTRRQTHEDFVSRLKEINPDITVNSKYVKSSEKVDVTCNVCGFSWLMTPNHLMRGHGCPQCAVAKRPQCRAKTHEQFLNELETINPTIEILETYINIDAKIDARCSVCGHQWKVVPYSLLTGHGCPKCRHAAAGQKSRLTNEQFLSRLKDINSDVLILENYVLGNQKLSVECKTCHYQWEAAPNRLLQGSGCPKCAGRAPISPSQFEADLKVANPFITLLIPYVDSSTKVIARCNKCKHEWSVVPHSLQIGHGCPKCARAQNAKHLTKDSAQAINKIHSANPSITVLGKYQNSHTCIDVACNTCGYRWAARPSDLLRGHACPQCSGNIMKTHDDFIAELKSSNSKVDVLEQYNGANAPILVECKECHSRWKAKPHSLLKGYGCAKCAGVKKKTQQEFVQELENKNPNIKVLGEYVNTATKIAIECAICSHRWSATPRNLLKGSGCPNCARFLSTSFPEQALYFYIKQLHPDAINSYREIFTNQMELDIYIPSMKIGIEYDGIFWHSQNYSLKREVAKYQICKERGIKLIRVRESHVLPSKQNADVLIYANKDLDNTIRLLGTYLALPSDIDTERDVSKIRAQYITQPALLEST